MKITKNLIQSNYSNIAPKEKKPELQKEQTFGQTTLPSFSAEGASMVNTSMPISYSKIAEIEVPGVKDKASVYKLANGQRVVILPKKGPTVVKTSYNVGSFNETEDIRGMSHYIEHNLFNGSKSLEPQEYDKRVKQMGGYSNANTSYTRTNYFLQLQLLEDNFLDEAIRLNAMQTQFPTFPEAQLEKEKEPVKSEIDVYKDIPSDNAVSIVHKALFGIDSPSSNLVLGTKDNINSFNREKVLDYFNTWYTPDNAVTVITGDVEPDETMAIVSKYFNKKPDYSKVNQRYNQPLSYIDHTTRTDIISQNSYASMITMGFAIPENISKEDLLKLDALLYILEAPNSRLSKALDKFGLSSLGLFTLENVQNKPDGAKALVLNISSSEEDLEEILKIIFEELAYISNNPPTETELNNYKKNTLNGLNSIAEESSSINSVLSDMAFNNDYNYFNNKRNTINTLSSYDVSATAQKFLDLSKTAICVTHSKNTTSDVINNNYNHLHSSAKTVSFGRSNPKDILTDEINNCRISTLPNNIENLFTQGNQGSKNILDISIKSKELDSYSNPAFMVLTRMLDRGSSLHNDNTYKEIKSAQDIDTFYSANFDGIRIASAFYDDNMQTALQLIKETLLNPNFTQEEFERAKKTVKDIIVSSDITASSLIDNELYKSVKSFASKEEDLKAIDALTLDDIRALYSHIISTSQFTSTLTAPINEKPYLMDIFNLELSQGMPVFKPVDKSKNSIYMPITEPKILTSEEENAQANIIQSYTYKKTENVTDTAKIQLLNLILGGGMSSRLFHDLRENQKLAYHVSSNLGGYVHDLGRIDLVIETTTDSPDPKEGSPENVTKSLNAFQKHINLLKSQNVTDEELHTAKLELKAIILDGMETNFGKNSAFESSNKTLYGVNYDKALFEAIDTITPDDIRAAANYVFANQPVTSIVASKKTLDTLNLK